jgi:hypothetical protein
MRVVPEVAVSGAQGGNGMLDALMAMMVKRDAAVAPTKAS